MSTLRPAFLAFVLTVVSSGAMYGECNVPAPILNLASDVREDQAYVRIHGNYAHVFEIKKSWRGNTVTQFGGTVDTVDESYSGRCMTGAETLRIEARGFCEEHQPAVFSGTYMFDPTPRLTLTTTTSSDTTFVNAEFWFRNGAPGSLLGKFFPAAGGPPQTLNWESDVGTGRGARSGIAQGGGFIVYAVEGCTGIVTTKTATAVPGPNNCEADGKDDENACKECVGTPIHTASRNMRYSEQEPLPGIGDVLPFRRNYDSQSRLAGAFGSRWSSIFSASLHEDLNFAGSNWVNVVTESADQYLYRQTGTGYQQVLPSGPRRQKQLTRASDGSWIHVDEHRGIVRTYSADGKPVRYRNTATGREIAITWVNETPVRVDDSWGAWALLITTDASARITSIALEGHTDLTWSYFYDADNLVRVDSPVGTWRTYEYPWVPVNGSAKPLSVVRDGAGKLIESHDYSSRNATTSLQQTDDITSIAAPVDGRVAGERMTTVTYASGRVETYYSRTIAGESRVVEVDGGCTSCGSGSLVTSYDPFGNLVRSQSAGGYIEEKEYDASGMRVSRRRTALRPTDCDPATDAARCRLTTDTVATAVLIPTTATETIEYEYTDLHWPDHPTLIRTASVAQSGGSRTEAVTYDPATGQVLTRSITGWTGEPLRQETRTTATTLYDGIAGAAFNPEGTFDAAWLSLAQPAGMRRSVDGPRIDVADVVSYVYYPVHASVPNRLRGRLAAVRNAAGHIQRMEDYDLFGNPLRMVDANGVTQTYAFDRIGRMTTSSTLGLTSCDTAADPVCATTLTHTRAYSGAGPLAWEKNAGGSVTAYDYDDRGRPQTTSRGPSLTDLRERIELTYDPLTGRKSREKFASREAGTWVTKRDTSYGYDSFARLEHVTHADGTSVSYAYDSEGRVKSVKDENHQTPNTFYSYDAAGRLVEVTQTAATAPGGNVRTQYSYDLDGNLTSVTDPNGNVTTYVYDDFGQMLRQSSPVSGVTTYFFDVAGQLTSSTDANGATTTRSYDVLGRVTQSTSTRGSDAEAVTWTYDGGTASVGRLASMSDPSGSTEYQYDRRGLLLMERKTVGAATYTTRFTYDADGNRSRIVYPSGRVVDYTFDYAGRPFSASSAGSVLVASAKYLPFGPPTEIAFGNATTRLTTYDTRYRPSTHTLTGANGAIAQYAYSHDAIGNITAIQDQLDPAYDRTFSYDPLNRLTGANTGQALWGTGSYTYDAMGNLLSSTLGAQTQQFSLQGTTPRLTNVTTGGVSRPIAYDAAGNELTGGMDYSARNLLAATDAFEYQYDGRGVRTVTEFTGASPLASVVVSPTGLRGGETAQGTVTLTAPAPAAGAAVRLVSSKSNVRVPATVVVPPGAASATFSIDTDAVDTDTQTSITATRGTTAAATVALWRSCALESVTLSGATITGGSSVTATVTLRTPAGAAGAQVQLTTSSAAATVPASLQIAAGESTATITIATAPVATNTAVTITAELCGTVLATLTVRPAELTSVTLTPSTVRSGSSAVATVELNGPAPSGGTVVGTASTDPAIATTPSSITVAAGAASANFNVTTPRRDNQTSAVVSATLAGVTRSAALTVLPCTDIATPPVLEPGEMVWFDDTLPTGAAPTGVWTWDTTQYASGTRSHVNAPTTGEHEHYFSGATATMLPTDADLVFIYALIDPCNPPREIMLEWYDGTSWAHKAYWGEDLIQRASRVRVGDLPAAGEWVRLEVPATKVAVNGRTISGMSMIVYGGRVWFDRAGKRACTRSNTGPVSQFPENETVWFDDALPAGAAPTGVWSWDTTVRASGNSAHTEAASTGLSEHFFTGTTATFVPGASDELFAYVYLDPCNPPREIMFEWYQNGSWAHKAYWGEDLVQRASRVSMGNLPSAGGWVRLSVPASKVGLSAKTVSGMSFIVYGGKAWFDRVGYARCAFPAPAAPTNFQPNDFVWVDDAAPAGATLSGPWVWDTTRKVAGTQSMLSYAGTSAREFWFTGAPAITAAENDNMYIYALLDPCDPPREIMVWWYDGSWAHRAWWGENLMNTTSAGGVSMGPLPARGEWVRLEMPARGLGLANRPITGMSISVHSGRAWFDRAGKRACTAPVAAQPSVSSSEVVWFDDAPPAGATLTGTWSWNAQQRASGTLANMVPPGGERIEYSFTGAAALNVGTNDKLTVYALVDPCDPPREIMIGWYDGTWEHRAYWGEDLFQYGTAGPSRYNMGALPAAGDWVRLEIPASAVGLSGRAVTGISFAVFGGKAWFDRVGLQPAGAASLDAPRSRTSQLRARSVAFLSLLRHGRMGGNFHYRPVAAATPLGAGAATSLPATVAGTLSAAAQSTATPKRISLYTPELNLMAETAMTTAAAPPIAYEYVWFGGEPLVQYETATNTRSYYFNDHLGAPILQTDQTATVIWRVERDPYGTIHTVRTGPTRHQPLAFPGQEHDVQNELSYNIFRWYRSGWGRYTQADPIAVGGTGHFDARSASLSTFDSRSVMRAALSRAAGLQADALVQPFGYVEGNPTNYSDPVGLAKFLCEVLTRTRYPDIKANPNGEATGRCIYDGECQGPGNLRAIAQGVELHSTPPCEECYDICWYVWDSSTNTRQFITCKWKWWKHLWPFDKKQH